MAQKKPVTFEDLDLNRLPLPLVAALQKLEEETESFRKVHRLIDTVEVFVKLHTVAIVADVFDGEDVEPEVQGMLAAGLRTPSLGVWWMFAREFAKRAYLEGGREPLAPGLDRTATKKGALFVLMEGNDNLISFRNGYAHGATPDNEKCEADLAKYAPRLYAAIAQSEALLALEWLWSDAQGQGHIARGAASAAIETGGLEAEQAFLRHGDRTVPLHPLLVRQEDDRFFFYNDLKKDAANFLNYEFALHHRDKALYTHLLERFPIKEWSKQAPEDFTARVEELTETFKGRQEQIADLVHFCSGPSRGIRMIWGGPGIGKSALMARLVQILKWPEDVRRAELGDNMPTGSEEHPVPTQFEVVEYFVRRGEASANALFFLQNLCQRLDRIQKTGVPLGKTVEDLRRNLTERLREISKNLQGRRFVLFIDGLDEGTEVDGLFESLPHEVPEGIVLLYASRNVPAVRYRVWDHLDRERKQAMTLSGLNPEDIRALLSEVVSKYEIEKDYIDAVAARSEGNPLYLKLLATGLVEQDFALNAIDALPANMADLYGKALRRIREQEPRALDLIRLLAEARSDLTEEMMAHLLGLSLDEIKHNVLAEAEELLHENDLTEDVDDYQLFHESLREYVREQYPQDCKDQQYKLFEYCLKDWEETRDSGDKVLDAHGLRYAFAQLGEHARTRFAQLKQREKDKGESKEQRKALFDTLLALCDREDYREESFRELGTADGVRSLCRTLLRQLIDVVPDAERPAIGARLIVRFHQEPEIRYRQTLERLDAAPASKDITRYARAGQTSRDRVLLAVRGALSAGSQFQLDKSLRAELKGWLEEANDDMLIRWANASLSTTIIPTA